MKLNYRRTFFIGLAFLSICAFWQLYDNVIPLMLKHTFHLSETVTGVIMSLDNVLALFLLPFFGKLSDRTDTKLGKRTPYIIAGTLIASAAMLAIPTANQLKNLGLFIAALGIALLAMASYRSPAVALMPDLTPKPLRSRANAVINLMGTLGGVYALIMMKLLISKDENPDYRAVYISVMALMIAAVVLLMLTIRERSLAKEIELDDETREEMPVQEIAVADEQQTEMLPEVRKSFRFLLVSIFLWFMAYNAVTTAFSRYAKQVWKVAGGDFTDCLMVAMAAAALAFIPIGLISGKFGRKKCILGGIVLMTVSYLAGCFFVEYTPWVNLMFALVGIGWASINVNSYPMIVEMSKSSNVGKYTGIYYTFSMAAQIVTPILSGRLLEVSYYTLFPYAVVFSLASFCTMLLVKHGDTLAEKKDSLLEHFDVDD